MPDQTAVPTYAELMDRANRAEEKIVRLISKAERTEERLAEERDVARAVIDRVRDALAGHPRCEEHPEGDVIKCGWKRAVASVQAAVDAIEENR